MRWSWPAFASGAAMGAVAGVLLVADCGSGDPGTARVRPSGLAASATPVAPPPADSSEDSPVAAPIAPEPSRHRATGDADPRDEGRRVQAPDVETSGSPGGDPPEGTVPADNDIRLSILLSGTRSEFAAPRLVVPLAPVGPVNAAAAQGLARAKSAADRAAASGGAVDVDELLSSADDGDREAAIGAAMRAVPPMTDRLLSIARDAKLGGSVRATALLAAIEAAPQDRAVAAAVVALTADRDVGVRRTAIELLARVGAAGADRAVALLRAGEYDDRLVEPLAETVAASDRALDFLLGGPAPEAAFSVLRSLAATRPADAAARARLIDRLPDVVRPLLGTTEILDHGHGLEAFNAVAAAGHVAFLRSVAVDTSLPTVLRLAAVDAAVGSSACADGLAALFVAALSDGRSPVELLRAVIERVPAAAVADGGVKAAIRALAENHPNAWLREEARAKLQASPPPGEGGSLKIVSGTYGSDGRTVDVTAPLASMVVGGRLVVEAGNALAGDPLVGVVKDLTVTYEWKGERRTRTIAEYETLTLP